MRRWVVQIPDQILSTRATELSPRSAELDSLVDDLVDTMRSTGHSVGVAAPQIGVSKRACCVDVRNHRNAGKNHGEFVLVNPEIVSAGGREIAREGCMSVPDLTGDVARPSRIVVRAMSEHFERIEFEAVDFEARAIQHEIDHLDGLVFLDRLVSADRIFRRQVYR